MKLHHSAGLGLLDAIGVIFSGLKNVHDRHAAVVETLFSTCTQPRSAKKERDETVWNLSRLKEIMALPKIDPSLCVDRFFCFIDIQS